MLVKDAYEYFEKKYNPKKYENIKTSFSFEDSTTETNEQKGEDNKYESIREKNKKKQESNTDQSQGDQNFSASKLQ